MIDVQPTPIRTQRGHLLAAIADDVVGAAGLSKLDDDGIRWALGKRIGELLDQADAATSVCVELEATERRLDRHVRTHRPCLAGQCPVWDRLRRTREQLARQRRNALRRLAGGGGL